MLPLFSSVSRPQKLATPTFHCPSWNTAVPAWFFSAAWPSSRIVYVTAACCVEITWTLVTLALASEARPWPAWAWMIEVNCEPSCSRATRCETGVLGLKNASQFAVIAFSSAAMLVVEDAVGEGAADVAAGAVLGDESYWRCRHCFRKRSNRRRWRRTA